MKNYQTDYKQQIPMLLMSILILLVMTACGTSTVEESVVPEPTDTQPAVEEVEEVLPTDPPEPTATPTPLPPPTETPTLLPPTNTPMPEPTETPGLILSELSADPQRVEFQAQDGKNLVGYYYPAKYMDAPVAILMHWAGGDQRDWCVIAPWLQNRLDENPVEMPGCDVAPLEFQRGGSTPWWDASWFPTVPEGISFAIFTFDFRDFGESEAGMNDRSEWAMDALAAFETAVGMQGVDGTQMVAMGASIGADGAPDGCYLYNQAVGEGCLGALSLSPGSYFDMDYGMVVTELNASDPPVPVRCLAAEFDGPSPETCNSGSGEQYQVQIYLGRDEHGMMLVDPIIDPNPLVLWLDLMALIFAW